MLGLGLSIPRCAVRAGDALTLTQQVAALFAAGEQGIWLDLSDFSTMFQDSAGTTPVTAVEQPVGLILDKSGRGNHASQATATSRPVLKVDGAGKYYLLFDGVDDSLVTAAINMTATDKMTIFAGHRKLNLNENAGVLVELGIGGSTGGFSIFTGINPNRYSFFGNGSIYSFATQSVVTASASYNSPVTNVLSCFGDISGDSNKLRINAVDIGTATGDQGLGNYGNLALFIGNRSGGTVPYKGNLYSLIIRGAASSAAQITSGEQYAASKSGVTL